MKRNQWVMVSLGEAKIKLEIAIEKLEEVLKDIQLELKNITEEDGTRPFPLAANLEIFRDRLNYQLLNDKVKQLPNEIAYMIRDWPLKSGATWDEDNKSWKW